MEAIATASYIRNMGPVAGLSKTPEELWSGKVPTIKRLRSYGSKACVSLEKFKRKGKMGVWEDIPTSISKHNSEQIALTHSHSLLAHALMHFTHSHSHRRVAKTL